MNVSSSAIAAGISSFGVQGTAALMGVRAANDQTKQEGAVAVQMIKNAAVPPPSSQPGVGTRINTYG
ncbi:MAG: hypothetical protein AAGB34_02455 [Planctomycetota bacterium]